MKVPTINILNALPILKELNETKLKIAVSYKVRKLIDECNVVTAAFEKRRQELLEEHAEKDDEAGQYKFPEDDKQALEDFNRGIQLYIEEEVDMNFPMLSLEDFPDDFGVEPANLDHVRWFIEDAA